MPFTAQEDVDPLTSARKRLLPPDAFEVTMPTVNLPATDREDS